jgi:iron complex transport system ATP-binding protein
MSIRANRVSLALGGRTILRDVDLTVADGQTVGLIGPNGSGKSTLLRTIYRLHRPRSGTVLLDGQEVHRMPPRALARRIAVVTQDHEVPFDQTVWELTALGRLPHGGAWRGESATDRTVISTALERVGAAHLASRIFHTLSGGEKQRVLIARALAQQCDHLILDEPTNHLDVRYQLEMVELVAALGVTVLLSLHDLNLAAAHCDRIYLLADGTIRAAGTPEQVLTPALVRAHFGIDAAVTSHPVTGRTSCCFPASPSGRA